MLLNEKEKEWFRSNHDKYSVVDMAVMYNTSRDTINGILKRLGIKKKHVFKNGWTKEEIKIVSSDISHEAASDILNRSVRAVISMRQRLKTHIENQ